MIGNLIPVTYGYLLSRILCHCNTRDHAQRVLAQVCQLPTNLRRPTLRHQSTSMAWCVSIHRVRSIATRIGS